MTQPMPGGDLSTKYPIRMAMGILYNSMDTEELRTLMKEDYSSYFKYGQREVDITLKQLENDFNTARTSSMGRVLDSVSVLLGISRSRGYEGECSMKLESAAKRGHDNIRISIKPYIENKKAIINTSDLLLEVIELLKSDVAVEEIACAAQRTLAESLSEVALMSASSHNVDKIGVTGGVFYNEFISEVVKQTVEDAGYTYLQHEQTCAGDGSVSMGQCAVAGWLMNDDN